MGEQQQRWETHEGKRRRVFVSRRNGALQEAGDSFCTSVRITAPQRDFLVRWGAGNLSAAVRYAVDRLMEQEGVS
jgi:hypothetical protein